MSRMATRRTFGSVRKLPSGRYQVRHPDGSGRLVAAPSTFARKADADAWLKAAEVDQTRGTWQDPRAGRVGLTDYATGWLEHRDLRPRTRELYASLLRLHIAPDLGETHLRDLSPARVRAWHSGLVKRKGSGSTVPAKAYRLLRTILGTAESDGLVARNPCVIRGAGSERTPERPLVTLGQVSAIAGAVPPRYRALVVLAATGGLRFGELAALTRGQVDLDAGSVRVDRAMVETDDGKVAVGPPKSQAGRRTVRLPASAVSELSEHLAAFVPADSEALVFAGDKGAPLRRRHFVNVWAKALVEAGVPAGTHLHDLRHLAATLAATTGATTKELMARIGHSSPRAALIYQHAGADRDAVIAAALEDVFAGHLGGPRATA